MAYYRVTAADVKEAHRRNDEWRRREGTTAGDFATHYRQVRRERERALPVFGRKK